MTSEGRIALKARWILPVAGPPLRDAAITFDHQKILAVGENAAGGQPEDLGNVAILPAPVNAHTHLEFSSLQQPLAPPGSSMPAWIQEVIRWRCERDEQPDANQQRLEAVRRGVLENLNNGTTTIGEIATQPWMELIYLQEKSLCSVLFLELLALQEERAEFLLEQARSYLQQTRPHPQLRYGLSPHAPYTIHPRLLEGAIQTAQQLGLPLAMHLAESVAELELLQSASGPLVEMLRDREVWDPSAIRRGSRPMDYLEQLAAAPRSLIIHGNYLVESELKFLAERADHMSVVYCPRTHHYFGHARYPLREMVALGVHVALGTDSRASSPDLSLLAEMRFAARQHPGVDRHHILEMGTINGATALGFTDRGTLEVGKRADLAVVRLPEREADPLELLLGSEEPLEALICAASAP